MISVQKNGTLYTLGIGLITSTIERGSDGPEMPRKASLYSNKIRLSSDNSLADMIAQFNRLPFDHQDIVYHTGQGRLVPQDPRLVSASQNAFGPNGGVRRPLPAATEVDVLHTNTQLLRLGKGEGGTWKYVHTLYQKGRGINQCSIYVFVLLDVDANILERMIVKVQGQPSLEEAQSALEIEFGVQSQISNKGCDYIVNLHGTSIRPQIDAPHLLYGYMEYAGFGNLLELLYGDNKKRRRIPEAFAWIVFRGLAEALFVLATGRAALPDWPPHWPDNNEKDRKDDWEWMGEMRRPDWKPFVHFDLKLPNVVLADEGTLFPAFKTPKMIDFGIVEPVGTIITRHWREYGLGTRGFIPPELYSKTNDDTTATVYYNRHGDNLADTRSDIYALGLLMLNLMDHRHIAAEWEGGDISSKIGHSDDNPWSYSKNLEDLVAACLENSKASRPSLPYILYKTRMGMLAWEEATEAYRGRTIADILPSNVIQSKVDPFTVGSSPWGTKKKRGDVNARAPPPAPQGSIPRRPGPLPPREKLPRPPLPPRDYEPQKWAAPTARRPRGRYDFWNRISGIWQSIWRYGPRRPADVFPPGREGIDPPPDNVAPRAGEQGGVVSPGSRKRPAPFTEGGASAKRVRSRPGGCN
ncbi:kinase-like protein [Pleomassaria siparia CBS 279.74]|uniref:non-specific serine/threonine protein kinase n=1 Tax=Pleomassaria siparia CBS 279.74 TaxID=1314801 RepID=A0A6G1KPJ5_9PLEO|nr:kinase-like protein [Pleomassaria siparia CBS 279.74]